MMEHHQKCKGVSAEHQAGLGVCRATQHFDDGTSKYKEILLFHCFTTCYVFDKEETLAFFRKNPCNPLRNERQNEIKSAVILSYLRNQRAIGPFITHCHQQKFFTPLQAHGMEKITPWRGRKFSLATQKNKAILDKQACSNKILQNKRK